MTLRRPPQGELRDAYRVPGFTPSRTIRGLTGDPHARVIPLTRRPRKPSAARVAEPRAPGTTGGRAACGTCHAATSASILEFELRRVDCRRCGGVKRERLDWLAANPHYTKRFALCVGKQCRGAAIKDVADAA